MREEEAGGAVQKEYRANKGNILGQARKKEAKEKKAGRAIQKERGANKGNIFVQPPKKGRRREREKRRVQIENKDEQREPRKTTKRRKKFFLKGVGGSWKEATRRRGRHGRNKSSAPLVPPLCKGDAITAHSQHY